METLKETRVYTQDDEGTALSVKPVCTKTSLPIKRSFIDWLYTHAYKYYMYKIYHK